MQLKKTVWFLLVTYNYLRSLRILYETNKIYCKVNKFLIVAVKRNNSILVHLLWWLHVSVILHHLQANL